MNMLFIYMVKAAVYLIAFYLVYSIMLSRDTSYTRNRVYILLSFALALILPLITFQTIKPLNIQFFGKLLSEVFITGTSTGKVPINSVTTAPGILQIIYSVYFIGILVLILKLSGDLLNILFLILRRKSSGSRIIRFHGFNTSGFSAMGYIFINTRLLPEEAGEIIKHEQNHLSQNHFIDIIFIELVKAFQWFNPAVYLFNRSLRAVHEYQADQECLSSGVPVVNYQSLILSQVFKSGAFNLTNSFSNPSLIKKRMIMMTKKRTSAIADLKLLLVVPVIGLVFLAISAYREIPESQEKQIVSSEDSQSQSFATGSTQLLKSPDDTRYETTVPPTPSEITNGSEETPFVVVEEMPEFPGGPAALLKYIGENTQYPAAARENNVQGRVIIRFCITAEGGVSQASTIKGVSPELDEEAIRVVKTLPAFKPGKQDGKAVPVWYMVPISFTLK